MLRCASQVASPSFYQYVSNVAFKELIKIHYPLNQAEEDIDTTPMTREEENALRFVAGHVCRKVQKQLQSSSVANKEEIILFIMDLTGDEMDENRGTDDWTNLLDRRGLWHVSDDTFIVEDVARKHFRSTSAKNLHEGAKKNLVEAIMSNEDLLFEWALLSSRVDDDVGATVLRMIVELYTTIRGHAFTASCVELYKQAHKKKIQKSKGLRRKLLPNDTEDS